MSDQIDFGIDVSEDAGAAVVTARGELDMTTAPEFLSTLRAALARAPTTLDLAALRFMDSSGIRALDELLRACRAEGWNLVVAADLHPNVRSLLEMTGMLDALPMRSPG